MSLKNKIHFWNSPTYHLDQWFKLHQNLCLGVPHRHDEVIKRKHFPRYWPFVRGIHRSPVNSPHKGQRRRALMFPLICTRINGWVNNGEAGDMRRYRCSGSLEPEYSCHDRDWIMELPMEADILTFTGILTPEYASVASCCWPALCAGLLCCNFLDMLTPVPFYHFFSSLILLFIYV